MDSTFTINKAPSNSKRKVMKFTLLIRAMKHECINCYAVLIEKLQATIQSLRFSVSSASIDLISFKKLLLKSTDFLKNNFTEIILFNHHNLIGVRINHKPL